MAVVWPSLAAADTITIVSDDFQGALVGWYFEDDPLGQYSRVVIGSVEMANGPGALAAAFEAYCVEIVAPFLGDELSIDVEIDLMSNWTDPPWEGTSVNAGLKAAWLYNTYNPVIQFQPTTAAIPGIGSVAVDIARSALAMAIWEVLYEDVTTFSYDVSNSANAGRFFVWCDPLGSTPVLRPPFLEPAKPRRTASSLSPTFFLAVSWTIRPTRVGHFRRPRDRRTAGFRGAAGGTGGGARAGFARPSGQRHRRDTAGEKAITSARLSASREQRSAA